MLVCFLKHTHHLSLVSFWEAIDNRSNLVHNICTFCALFVHFLCTFSAQIVHFNALFFFKKVAGIALKMLEKAGVGLNPNTDSK